MKAPAITPALLRRFPLPSVKGIEGKDDRGCVLAVAGSLRVPGAGWFSGTAAFRAGAGRVQLVTPRFLAGSVGLALPEAGIIPARETASGDSICRRDQTFNQLLKNADALLVGPGLMNHTHAVHFAVACLQYAVSAKFVFDAYAITADVINARRLKKAARNVVITPHHGEMAALLGVERSEIAKQPLKYAAQVASGTGCTVILKADTTYITSGPRAWYYDGGSVGLATAGSGDVLAGLLAGLLARGADPVTASLWSVYAHGEAGRQLSKRVATIGFLAHELLPLIPKNLGVVRPHARG